MGGETERILDVPCAIARRAAMKYRRDISVDQVRMTFSLTSSLFLTESHGMLTSGSDRAHTKEACCR